MTVIVTFEVICDLCQKTIEDRYETCYWSDESSTPPEGWDAFFDVPEVYRTDPTASICDACPECQKAPDWDRYRTNRLEAE